MEQAKKRLHKVYNTLITRINTNFISLVSYRTYKLNMLPMVLLTFLLGLKFWHVNEYILNILKSAHSQYTWE